MRKIADSLIFDIIPKVNKTGYSEVQKENKKVGAQLNDNTKKANNFTRSLRKVGTSGASSVDTLAKSFTKVLSVVGLVVAAAKSLNFIKAGVELASDVEENNNKISAVFRETEGTIRKTIDNISGELKIGQVQIERDVSNVGAVLAGLGFGSDKLTKNTENVLRMAYDAASFHNLDFQRSIGAIQSAMLGESEALKQATGIIVQENQMMEYSKTLGVVWKDLNNASKAQLRLNFIMESLQKQGAAGDYEKTAQSYANLSKAISTTTEDIKAGFFATLQQELIPGLVTLQNYLIQNKEGFIAMGAGAGSLIDGFKSLLEFISPVTEAVTGLTKTVFELGVSFASAFDNEALKVFAEGFLTFLTAAINNMTKFLSKLEPVVRLLGGVTSGVAKITGKSFEVAGKLIRGDYRADGNEFNSVDSGAIPSVNNTTNSTGGSNTNNVTINAPVNDASLNRIIERNVKDGIDEWEQQLLSNDLL